MKKIYLFAISAVMLSMFASCDDKLSPEPTPDPSQKMTVKLDTDHAVFTYGDTAKVSYTYTGGILPVTVTFPEDSNFIYVDKNNYGKGVISIVSRRQDNKAAESTVSISFRRLPDTTFCNLKVTMNSLVDPTGRPVVVFAKNYNNSLVYPEEREDKLLGIDFTISGKPATELSVTGDDGIVTKAALASDGRSGHIDVAAADSATWKSMPLTVKTSNAEGDDTRELLLKRAYIEVSQDCSQTIDLPIGGGSGAFKVEATVPYSVKSEALASDDGWFTMNHNAETGEITVSTGANDTYYLNYGRVTVTDDEGLAKPFKIDVYQDHLPTSQKQDREALIAYYYSTNMSQWTSLAGWNDRDGRINKNNKHWNTDAPLKVWAGVYVVDSSDVARVLDFKHGPEPGLDPIPCGPLPAEFGLMDMLETMDIQSGRFTGEIPLSIKNMLHLYFLEADYYMGEEHVAGRGFAGRLDSGWLDILIRKGSLRYLDLMNNFLEGPVPACLAEYLNAGKKLFIRGNHLSGQVPQEVADSYMWNTTCNWAFFEILGGGTWGDMNLLQADDYALWVGDKPENVIQVGDHWEWMPGTNPYH